jgi:3-phenylpropionate/trans-cinnamate dioxygenase ferredoxin reductase subunit
MAGMLIVGAGECGTRAALALREAGYDGPVTLLGAEPHPPYERPPLSKDAIVAASPAAKPIGGSERLAEAGIDFRPGLAVTEIDRAARVVRCDGAAALAYDKLLLATGARPRTLPLPGAGTLSVATLRTLEDAVGIRASLGLGRRLAVIGGGFIGLELAASARRLGTEVAVIEALPRLLSRGVPAEIAAALYARHLEEGVSFHFGARIAELSPRGVALGDGTLVPADLVVTSDPAVFAAGDCCSFPHPLYDGRRLRLESWRSAQEQGTLAARNMLGEGEPTSAVPWFWSDQYDLTLQISGIADGAAAAVRRELADGAFVVFHLAADGRLLAASGIGRGNAVAKDVRLAEMLIARRGRPDPAALADPAQNLKRLL